jgi:predicted transcriptional regulator
MTSNPCTIDAEKSVAYAAKMMQEEDVVLPRSWRATD